MAATGLPPGRRPLSGTERWRIAAVGGATAAAHPSEETADPAPPSSDLAISWLDPAGGCVVVGGRGRGAAAREGRQHRRDKAAATARVGSGGGGDDACTAAGGSCRGKEMCAGDGARAAGPGGSGASDDGGVRLDGGGAGGCRGCGLR
uniref:DUF834 domain-containing protein n=1 Tax=Oryza meridionalis TaxID=40149 RepID=A0A0E0E7C3_9ORYZ